MAYITSWYWNKGDFRKVNEDSFTLQRVRARKKELIFAENDDGYGNPQPALCIGIWGPYPDDASGKNRSG